MEGVLIVKTQQNIAGFTICFLAVLAIVMPTGEAAGARPVVDALPNIVVVFTDDQGYADVGCFGAEGFETPHLDRMAEEGMRFTDFYSAAPVCTPSRAALMTGCYAQRVSLPSVLFPNAKIGLNVEETTIAEVLKSRGYATACYGKWHLGHHPEFLPTRHGFDEYFGLPYSNDMGPRPGKKKKRPDLPLIEGEKVVVRNPDQSQLTTWYTERAVKFIEKHRDGPFFVYLPHTMPHVPLHVSDKFKGKSKKGIYGDVIMEIDWSVGEILSTLKRLGLDERTLVIFASDNGPWLSCGARGGSAGVLREGKFTTFDGGMREPCIMRWPGKIPAGTVCREVASTIDLLPTVAKLTGAALPERVIDGKNIWPLMSGAAGAKSPHDAYYFLAGQSVQAVRSGQWKLHLPHGYTHVEKVIGENGRRKSSKQEIGLSLFDLSRDMGELENVAGEHPDIVERLRKLAEAFERDLKANVRAPGKLAEGL